MRNFRIIKSLIVTLLSVLICSAILVGCTLPNDQSVTFEIKFYNADVHIDSVDTVGNEAIILPESPSRDGYSFGGWFYDNTTWKTQLTADSYVDTELTEDVSVYAKWTKNIYDIKFVDGDGLTLDAQSLEYGAMPISMAPNEPTYKDPALQRKHYFIKDYLSPIVLACDSSLVECYYSVRDDHEEFVVLVGKNGRKDRT